MSEQTNINKGYHGWAATTHGKNWRITTMKRCSGHLVSTFSFVDNIEYGDGVVIVTTSPCDEKNQQKWQYLDHGKVRVTEKAVNEAHKIALVEFKKHLA